MQTDFVRRTGHLQIQHKDYFRFGSGNPAAYGIARYERVIDIVKQDPVLAPMLAVVTPTLQFGGIAGNFAAGVSRTVYVNGVVVDDQNRMREWNDYGQRILTRRLSLSGTAPDSAVIGTGVARVLQLCAALDVPDCASADAKTEAQGAALPADIVALSQHRPARRHGSRRRARRASRSSPPTRAVRPTWPPSACCAPSSRASRNSTMSTSALHLSQAQKLVFGTAAAAGDGDCVAASTHRADPGGAAAARRTAQDHAARTSRSVSSTTRP